MTTWTPDELQRLGAAEEIEITSHRPDGSLRPYVIIWMVGVDGELYVRSAYGAENGWFRRAQTSGTGSVRVGAIEHAVRFEAADAAPHAAIDAEYRRKYGHFPADILGTVVGDDVHAVTMRVVSA